MRRVSLVFMVLLLLPGVSQAYTLDQEVLVGLKGVMVLVDDLVPEVERLGLKRDEIQTDIELRLWKAGIKMLTEKEWRRAPGRPFLYLTINTIPGNVEPGLWSFKVRVKLIELVKLSGKARAIKAIWDKEMEGTIKAADAPQIRDYIGDMVDTFVNNYQVANPKK